MDIAKRLQAKKCRVLGIIAVLLLGAGMAHSGCGGEEATPTPIPTADPLAQFEPTDFPTKPIGSEPGATQEPEEMPQVVFRLTILHHRGGSSQLIDGGEGLEDFGGVARFATLAQALKVDAAQGLPDPAHGVIMLSAGDSIGPGPEFEASLQKDTLPFYDTIALDEIGYDAIAIGNDDFNFGPEVLAAFISGFTTPVPFISANLDVSAEASLESLETSGRVAKVAVVQVGQEIVGIVGVITPRLPFNSSPRNVRVDEDVVGAVRIQVNALESQGIDKIIVLTNFESIEEDFSLVSELQGVDIIVSGAGELLANQGDLLVPGDGESIFGPYPLMATDATGQSILVVTTVGSYLYLGRLLVGFDEMGRIVEVGETSKPIRVAGGDRPDAVAPDPELLSSVVEPVKGYVDGLATRVVGTTDVPLDGQRPSVRTMETNEGNLIADALKWQAVQLADAFGILAPSVGIQNGGGIRNDNIIPPGNITERDINSMVPFNNMVTVVQNVTPAQFKEVLENAVSLVESEDGRFAQVSGFSMTWDPLGTPQELDSAGEVVTPGARVRNVVLDEGTEVVRDGEVLNDAPSLNIATISFLARGGDQSPYRNAEYMTLGVTDQQAVSSYIKDALGGHINSDQYPEGGEGRIRETE